MANLPSPPPGLSPTLASTVLPIRKRLTMVSWITTFYVGLTVLVNFVRGTPWPVLVIAMAICLAFTVLLALRSYTAIGEDWLKAQGAFASSWVRTTDLIEVQVRYASNGARLCLTDANHQFVEVPFTDVFGNDAMCEPFLRAFRITEGRRKISMDSGTENMLGILKTGSFQAEETT